MSDKKELKKDELEKVSGGSRIRDVDGNEQKQDATIKIYEEMDKQHQPENTNSDGMVIQHKI